MQRSCNRLFSLIVTAFIFLCVPVSIKAATYYVDVASRGGTCNDSNAGTSIASPWCTTSKITNLVAGDKMQFRQGTYPFFNVRNSGTASNQITFEPYQNEKVTINGTGSEYAIRLNGAKYIIIKGFEVTNATENGIYILNASNNTIDRNLVYNNHDSGIRVYGNRDTVVINNVISNNIIRDHVQGLGNSDGINQFGRYVSGTIITGNTVYNNSDDGIDVYNSHDNVIEKNIVYNQGNNPNYPGDGNGIKVGSGGTNYGAEDLTGGNNIIRQNISFNNKANGFDSNSSGGNKYYHNIAFRNGNNGFRDAGRNSISGIGEAEGCPSTDRCKATFAGNIGLLNGTNGTGKNVFFDSTQTLYSDYNIWYSLPYNPNEVGIKTNSKTYTTLSAFSTATGFDTHSLSVDPQFILATTDPTIFNFRLKETSPAINKGPASTIGTVYVQDSKPDIGVYEYQTGSTTVTPVATLTTLVTMTQILTATSIPNTITPQLSKTPVVFSASDVNKDGAINYDDALEVLRAWLGTGSCKNAQYNCDVNRNGKVNAEDYSIVIRNIRI